MVSAPSALRLLCLCLAAFLALDKECHRPPHLPRLPKLAKLLSLGRSEPAEPVEPEVPEEAEADEEDVAEAALDAVVETVTEIRAVLTLPLPIMFLTVAGLALMWEAFYPQTDDLHSSIVRQLSNNGRALFGLRPGAPDSVVRQGKSTAMRALRSQMAKICHVVPVSSSRRQVSERFERQMSDASNLGASDALTSWVLANQGCGPERIRGSDDWEHPCVIFFERHTTMVRSGDRVVNMRLFRVGSLEEEVDVSWSTADGTALADQQYVTAAGVARFGKGKDTALIQVSLLDSCFHTERFFIVHTNSVCGQGELGCLPFGRVRVFSGRSWPDTPGVHAVKGKMLVWRFILMLIKFRGEKYWNVVRAYLWLDFERVVLSSLLLNYALYDFCLTHADDPKAYPRVPVILFLKLFCVLINRWADRITETQRGGSGTLTFLQGHLLHKYLQVTHDHVDTGRFYHLFADVAAQCIEHAFLPTFKILRSFTVLALSLGMTVCLPWLKGKALSRRTLDPLFLLVVFVPIVFYLALWSRRKMLKESTQMRRDAHTRMCEAVFDIINCRQFVRALDAAYPSHQMFLAYDRTAVEAYLDRVGSNGAFMNDTQWVAQYLGELTNLLAICYGSYSVLNGTASVGEFAVCMSLFTAVLSALYSAIESFNSLNYAYVCIEEMCRFLNASEDVEALLVRQNSGRQVSNISLDDAEEPVWRQPQLFLGIRNLCLRDAQSGARRSWSEDSNFMDDLDLSADLPLGYVYTVRAEDGCDIMRRQVGHLLRGTLGPGQGTLQVPSFVRTLTLTASAAGWVRARDAVAVLAVLGLPFQAPEGQEPHYGLDSEELMHALRVASARCVDMDHDDPKWSSTDGADEEESPSSSPSRIRHQLPSFDQSNSSWMARAAKEFRQRMESKDLTVLSSSVDIMQLLRPVEVQMINLARGLLADPDVLVLQDMLVGLALSQGEGVLRVVMAWQRLGGLRGMVSAWELASGDRFFAADPCDDQRRGDGRGVFPAWLTRDQRLCRTVVLSESSIASAGLKLDAHADAWLDIGRGTLRITSAGPPDDETSRQPVLRHAVSMPVGDHLSSIPEMPSP